MLYPEEEDMPSIETELTLLDGAAYRSRSPSQSSNDSSSDVVVLGELESSDDVDQKYEEVENLFRQISGWQSIKEQCKKYSSIKESEWSKLMCRLEVYVEYSHLCNVSREFALRAVYEYRDVCYIFEDVIYSKIFNHDLTKRSIYRDQLHVVLRIGQHSPEMPILEFDSLEVAAEKQLQFYHGYVRAISLPKKYVRSTRYVCQNRICGSGYYQRVVHTFDKEDITNLMHACIYCNNLMEEDTSHRIFGKAALLDVRDLTLLYDVTDQDGPALLCCRDELIPQIEQEKKYIFTCIPASSTGDRKQVLEVICVSKITRYCFKPLSSDSLSILRRITHGNPAENENVFSASSWETVFYITNIFGKSIAPGNAYFGIKLVLLLSMAQCASDMDDIITTSICFSADDTRLVNLLLKYAAIYCPYYVYQSMLSRLAIGEPVENYDDFLKQDYLYIFDDIQHCGFDETDCVFLRKALKEQCVPLNFGQEGDHKSPDYQLQFASRIWASMNNYSKKGIHKKLFNSFNLTFQLDAWESDNTQKVSSSNDVDSCNVVDDYTLSFSEDQWQEYFDAIRAWKVKFTAEAESLIEQYCVKRKAICEEINDSIFPESSKQTLFSLSQSFAKLAFAAHVQVGHVIVAIMLVEESFLVKTGRSPFHSLLRRDSSVKVMSLFHMSQSRERMLKFQKKILSFVNSD